MSNTNITFVEILVEIFPSIAWDRSESDPCERGTEGCCVNHSSSPDDQGCETW